MPPAVAAPPPTQVEPVSEVLHGVEITDPYRWLEDQNSPRTRAWLEEQTAYTRAYFDAIPDRERIRERVRELMAFKDVISEPWNVGDRYFFLKRQDDREQPVIVMRKGLFGEETVLVDPALRATGTSTAVSIVAISQDARFLAYSVRQGGTDHSALEILDIERNTVLPDRLPEGFCTGFVFVADGTGFCYSHRALRDPRPNYKAAFWHSFDSDRSQDVEVFIAGEEPNLFLGILDSLEADCLAYAVFRALKRPTTSLYLHSLEPGAAPKLLLRDVEGCFAPFFAQGRLFAYTDFRAPNFRIVCIALDDPDPTHWRDVVPESDRRMQQFALAGDRIFVTRVDRFSTQIEAFGIKDGERKDVPFSPHGTIDLLNPTNRTDSLFYSYTSITQPPTVYRYSTRDEKSCLWQEPNVPFDPSFIAVEETSYPSKDGTPIPLFLAARTDLLHAGPLPTFLTGYGGFGSCVTPRFSAFANFLIEQGLLFAVPALRGGSELGEEWHKEGKGKKRQNSFDDFIAAAEWLISEGRCARGRIAIGGGSNAGLLVGAAITQRPDLFRAATRLAIRQSDVDEHFGLWLPTRRSFVGGVLLMANNMAKLTATGQSLEEARYPFLDQTLIEFLLSIPAGQLLRPGERRSLMRRSLAGIVPPEILSRRTKQVGERTHMILLEKYWDELQSTYQTSLSSRLGYIHEAQLLKTICDARDGQSVPLVRVLWTISLEYWLRDLAARGILALPAASSPFRQREVAISA